MKPPHDSAATAGNAPLLAHLARGGTVLTTGRREARHLRRLYDRAQLAAGREVWPTADVLPLATWMAARWAELAALDSTLPVLLDPAQAAWPWRAHAADAAAESLLAAHDLADAARAAWVALRCHGGTLDLLDEQPGTRDQRLFQDWARRVEADLAAQGWLDPGLLELALAARAPRLECASDLLLAGFHRRTPALEALLAALLRGGLSADLAPLPARVRGQLYAAADPGDELQALAHWLRARLVDDPGASLAAIIPDLAARRDAVERVLEATLQPELELTGAQERDRLFDLAGGPPLAGLGAADAALGCLEACHGSLDTRAISRLLLNRHVGTGDGEANRTWLDLRLRDTGVARWTVAPLASFARQEACPGFALALESGAARSADVGLGSTGQWAQVFGEVLAAWRWPGDGALASDEYQAAQAFRDRLAQFASLARTAPPLRLEAALAEFRRLAQGPHQPERGDPSVLVFDRLEPPGVAFDGLWVAGLGAPGWPRAAAPDPFLPVWVQARLRMPGATASSSLTDALSTTDAWLASAAEVVFSWPQRQDDAQVDKSRVLPQDLWPLAVAVRGPGRADAMFAAADCETLLDDPAPALDAARARGGSRILQLQSQCPFRAFAELRLGAKPLERPVAGVDARQRGSVLHRVLERLWGELGGRAGLEQDAAELQALVNACVGRALVERLPAGTGRRVWELERDWQQLAAMRELELERQRDDFEVIAREAPVRRELAGLPLKVVPDRADRLADGSIVLIDYKTGDPKVGQWQGARPEQPQLPLYAVLLGDEVSGIAFAAVGAQAARFTGIGREAQLLPGLKAAETLRDDGGKASGQTWEQVRSAWTVTLTALAIAHLGGEASVDPKSATSCRHCHLGTLCRVSGGAPDEAEGDDE